MSSRISFWQNRQDLLIGIIILILVTFFTFLQILYAGESHSITADSTLTRYNQPEKTPDSLLPEPEDPIAIDIAPQLIAGPSPEYPLKALRNYTTGEVWVKILIDEQGDVRRALIEKESGEDAGFEEAALEAALKRRYHPAEYEDQPIACWISYMVGFYLKK